jgi:hypothetical protein
LLAAAFVLFVPFDSLLTDVLLLSAAITQLLFRLGNKLFKLLADSLSLKFVFALYLLRHLKLELGLLLVDLELPEL